MKSKLINYNSIIIVLLLVLLSICIAWKFPYQSNKTIHIGIAVYSMDDTYMKDYIYQLEDAIDNYDFLGKEVIYEVFDAKGSEKKQERQLRYMVKQKFDIMLVNPVKPSSTANILTNASDNGIPLILFNREPDEKDLNISDNIWYVGTDAKKSGILQGELIIDIWEKDKDTLDRNKNGKFDYVLVEGEVGHYDTIRRTNGFLETTRNIELNQLVDVFADWNRLQATKQMEGLKANVVDNVEAVICNNDDMALGVYDYFQRENKKTPLIIGINNNAEMNQKIKDGEVFATIDIGVDEQISHVCGVLADVIKGDTSSCGKVWYSEPVIVK